MMAAPIVLLGIVWLAVAMASTTRRPRDFACPPDEAAGQDGRAALSWVRDELNQKCMTILPTGVWAETRPQVVCSPRNRGAL